MDYIVSVIKWENASYFFKYIRPGERIILRGINNNIPIYHLSYLSVYQDESENWELYQEMNIFGGWNQTKKTAETAVSVTHEIINI